MDCLHMSFHIGTRTFPPTKNADGSFIAALGQRLHGVVHVHVPRIECGPCLISIPNSKNGAVNPYPVHMVTFHMRLHVALIPKLLVAGWAPIRDLRGDMYTIHVTPHVPH